MTTPLVNEETIAKIPALATLMALDWAYVPPKQCFKTRGNNQTFILKDTLITELKKRTFEFKGKTYPLSNNGIEQILRVLEAPNMQEGLLTANEQLYDHITFGIPVTEFIDGQKHTATIPIIDWDNPENNNFIVTEEFEAIVAAGTTTIIPDIVCFVNGLPLVIIEAKRPDSGNPNRSMVAEGISQNIRNQKNDYCPKLFSYSQLLISISGIDARYGTTKTPPKFWAKWHEEEITEVEFQKIKNTKLFLDQQSALLSKRPLKTRDYFQELWSKEQLTTDQDRLLISLLSKHRLLEFIRFFILFDKKAGKIAARHQQAFGVKALIKQVSKKKPDGGRKGGVIWHTTGSGKSFTMVFLSKALVINKGLSQCRIITVTDRIDLENQLSKTFVSGGAMGTSDNVKTDAEKYKATTGLNLAERIVNGKNRIIFTIIDKFRSATKLPECYNPSSDIIVLIDEGHRSNEGENHERMKKALPNAAFIAFTGTPLLKDDKTTNKFGPILHSYTMQDAIADGTVTPLLYEERKPVLDINEKAIDNWFEKITLGLSEKQKHDLKDKYSKQGQIYSSANRISLIAWDIAIHFNENFKKLGTGLKGQLAADSKLSAIRYKKALDATGYVTSAVIISPPDTREGHSDVDEAEGPEVLQWWQDNIDDTPENYQKKTIEAFATPGEPDILIVVDKLLTGFDEPKNAVLYIDKPLKAHNLIQAIARVNRLHEQKKHGLLIDYRGILKELDTAISDYKDLAERTQGGFDIEDLEGLYADISTEYKKLPFLHEELLSMFKSIPNKRELEPYRQLLIPKLETNENGVTYDTHIKFREDFYENLTNFGVCLKTALGSRLFHEDTAISEEQIAIYKDDLKFFTFLRKITRQDAEETVDFSVYEEQIRKLVDQHVIGEDVKDATGVYVVNELGQKDDPSKWSEEKLRNETDLIRSRLKRTIEQDLTDDPYAQKYFSELLKEAIKAAEALFDHPFKEYALFDELTTKVRERDVDDIPIELANNKHASAYFGVLKLLNDTNANQNSFINLSLKINEIVTTSVAEHSLNPQNIEAEIKQGLLPILFEEFGLEQAKVATDNVIEITRIGLSRGDF